MFDLERAVSEWRKRMMAAGIESPAPLQELELHLRDEIEHRTGFWKLPAKAKPAVEPVFERV